MNHDVADHIAALIVDVASKQGNSLRIFREEVPKLLQDAFLIDVKNHLIDAAIARLEYLGGAKKYSSTLAGDLIEISVARSLRFFDGSAPIPSPATTIEYDQIYETAQQDFAPLSAYYFGQQKWIDRVVASLLSGKISEVSPLADEVIQFPIPASDRVVDISHNQRSELIAATEDVASKLGSENSIDGDAGLRERFMAQLAAGKELLNAQSVRTYLLYETLVRLLGTLITKYRDQALGEAAKKLIGLLIEHIFGK